MTSTFRFTFFGIGLIHAAVGLSPAHAQVPPDAGALRQQIEQGPRAAPQPGLGTPEGLQAAESPPLPSGLQVQVRSFRIVGNTLLDAAQLQGALRSYLNRPLDYGQLQAAVAQVIDLYRRAGWVVRAFLPEQEIADGEVSIQVVEAVFGGTRMQELSAPRVSHEQIEAIVQAQQPEGLVLKAEGLDRAILLADDLPGVAVSGNLVPGEQPGETQLVLRLSREPLVLGEATLDNAGNRSTGSTRTSVNLALNSPFQKGDLLSASLIAAEGSDYLRLAASVPVASDGWRVGVNASSLQYKVLLSSFAALDAKGSSDSVGLEASYPLLRSRLHNLNFNAALDSRSFDNQAGGVTSSHYRSNDLSLGLAGNSVDHFAGGGSSSASLTLTVGQLDLSGSPNQAADTASTRTEGTFNKLRYSLARQQTLSSDLLLYASVSGQWADRNLDSSEKFYLGGANGVRAFPSNEAGGASGQLLSLELRQRLPQGFNLSVFFDSGTARTNTNNQYAGAPARNETVLEGYGLGLGWRHSSGLSLSGAWAHRNGNHPNPGAGGNDQDGSHVMDHWWFSANLPF